MVPQHVMRRKRTIWHSAICKSVITATGDQRAMDNKIGELIRTLREKENFSQAKLAELVGCDQTAISKIETGTRTLTDIEVVKRFADALKASLSMFLEAAGITSMEGSAAVASGAPAVPNPATDRTKEVVTRLLSGQGSDRDRTMVQRDLLEGRLNFSEGDDAAGNLEGFRVIVSSDRNEVVVHLGQRASEQFKEKLFPAPAGLPPPLTSLLFVGRTGDIAKVKTLIGMGQSDSRAVSVTVVEGWPGVGKTCFAGFLARDPEVLSAFPDGVLWTALGQAPNLFSSLARWATALGLTDSLRVGTLNELVDRLNASLAKRRMLLIVDDVWDTGHATPFLAVRGPDCRLLFTTRQSHVVQDFTNVSVTGYRLPVLGEEDAIKLLWTLAPEVVKHNEKACRSLVRDLERLPLALHVAGRLLRSEAKLGWGVSELIEDIRTGAAIIREKAPEDLAEEGRLPTVSALLSKSTDLLDERTRNYFSCLGVFAPKPATFDLRALSAVWEENDPKPYVRTLMAHGLLERGAAGRFQMHALLVAHARSLLET